MDDAFSISKIPDTLREVVAGDAVAVDKAGQINGPPKRARLPDQVNIIGLLKRLRTTLI